MNGLYRKIMYNHAYAKINEAKRVMNITKLHIGMLTDRYLKKPMGDVEC